VRAILALIGWTMNPHGDIPPVARRRHRVWRPSVEGGGARACQHSGDAFVWGIISDFDLVQGGIRAGTHEDARALAHQPIISVRSTVPLREASEAMLNHHALATWSLSVPTGDGPSGPLDSGRSCRTRAGCGLTASGVTPALSSIATTLGSVYHADPKGSSFPRSRHSRGLRPGPPRSPCCVRIDRSDVERR
jgi:hypothetical protein